MSFIRIAGLIAAATASVAFAADYPAPQEGTWIAKDFKFNTGETMAEMKVHYTTVGAKTGEPVLVLHGTTGSAASMLNPNWGGELLGAGQALDASRYYIIVPDSIGHGKSSKPSDGLRAKFPRYNYDDMVNAQYLLLTEHLGVKHLRLVIGNSMGGMETWLWAVKHPGFMDAAVPMASLPAEMGSRNWMLRRLITDSIRHDPAWMNGNYTEQPKSAHFASVFFGIATAGGSQHYQSIAPSREAADKLVDARLNAKFPADANDVLYQWDSSRDFNPGALEKIQARVMAINAADDERNPPETGVMDRELKRVKNGRVFLIPASEQTTGHLTTGSAKWYSKELAAFLQSVPHSGGM